MHTPLLQGAMLALLFTTTACGTGALGQTRVAEECGPDDNTCLMAGLGAPLAVGASLRPTISAQLRGSGAPSLHLLSASPGVMQADGRSITGMRPGIAALMMAMDDGTVIDFVHVWIKPANRLELHQMGVDGSDRGVIDGRMELVVGESLWLRPEGYADAQRLMGDADAEWKVEPPIAQVMRDGSISRRRLLARAAGEAHVHVETLGQATELDLVVHDEAEVTR
jgi:hypothetical protein